MGEPERPWAEEFAQIEHARTTDIERRTARGGPSSRGGFWAVIGAAVIVILVVWSFVSAGGSSGGNGNDDACIEAATARQIAATSTGEKRETAILYAATKQLECDAQHR